MKQQVKSVSFPQKALASALHSVNAFGSLLLALLSR